MKHAGGRPPIFKEPREIYDKFVSYIEYCHANKRFPNIAGLCVYLDISRETYYEYKNNKEEFNDTFKKIENILEDEVFHCHLSPPERIFYLTNKFNYVDKQEIDQKTKFEDITINIIKNE